MMQELSLLAEAIGLIQKQTRRNVSAQQIRMFLQVGRTPGVTMPELGRILAMPQGTVSRNVKALSHYTEWVDGEQQQHGFGLLYAEPVGDGSQTLSVYVTESGKKLLSELQSLWSVSS